jgi:hypothetical protein
MRTAVSNRFMMPPMVLEQANRPAIACQRQHTNEGQRVFRG